MLASHPVKKDQMMNSTVKKIATRHRAKWLATAGLALSLTVPLSASASHDGDAAVNLLVGATVAYALVQAVDGFDNDRNRRHDGDHRAVRRGDAHRYFRGDYRHRDKHWRQYLHQERHQQARHRRAHAQRHGYGHGSRHAYGHQPRTYAPHWYAHR
jgi:hypothetical protein